VNYPGVIDLFLAESLAGDGDPRNHEAIDESRLRTWEEVTLLGIRPILSESDYTEYMSPLIEWGLIPNMPLLNLREVKAVIVNYRN
jgi:hypothetical protein